MKTSKVLIADLQILGSAFFFGIGFIGQRAIGIDGVGPMTCNAFRFALSTIILIACMPWIPAFPGEYNEESDEEDDTTDILTNKPKSQSNSANFVLNELFGAHGAAYFAGAKRTTLFWGLILGVINFFASGLQQWGISLISANKVSFSYIMRLCVIVDNNLISMILGSFYSWF